MTIKAKLLGALSVILMTAFVATSLINYSITRDAVRNELLHSALPLTGKNIYSEIHAAMMKPILVSSSMANDTFLQDWAKDGEQDSSIISKYLSEIKNKYGFISTFFVSASTDIYYSHKGVLKKIGPRDPHDVWYYAFTRTGQEYDLDVDTNEAEDGKLTIFVNFRVEDHEGKLLGVTGVGINMDQAVDLLAQSRSQYGRNVYLVDQDGLIQVHPDRKFIEQFYITKAGGIRDVASKILQPRDEAFNVEYDWEGKHYLLSTRYIPEFQWHLIVEQEEGVALVTARGNMFRTLGIGLGVSILIIFLCVLTINHFQTRLERMANTDPLTEVANRNALEERFILSAYKADRYGEKFSIVILDLDGFKEVNDMQGHLAGDEVLKAVAETISRSIRPTDLVARWGGDEFIILMDGTPEDAEVVIHRIRKAMTHSSQATLVGFSSGITQFREGDDLGSMSQRADVAMYRAKNKGGNCVEMG